MLEEDLGLKKNIPYLIGYLGLILLSLILYYIHFRIFGQLNTTMYYTFLDICFIPLNILIVSLVFQQLIDNHARKEKLNKINMLVGLFFSEIGFSLMTEIVSGDISSSKIITSFSDLKIVEKSIKNHAHNLNIQLINCKKITELLINNKDLFISLISNENILEHEIFTDLLMSIIHLRDEILFRKDKPLTSEDYIHLQGDLTRVYKAITIQWVYYLQHLRKYYPYLYNGAIQVNPFIHINS